MTFVIFNKFHDYSGPKKKKKKLSRTSQAGCGHPVMYMPRNGHKLVVK